MIRQLAARERRALVFGVVTILLVVSLGRGVPALVGWTAERHARASATLAELTRAERAIRSATATRHTLAQANARLASYMSALLDGTTPSTAGAALAEVLAEAASVSDAQLGAVHLSADTAAHSILWRAVARATVHGDLKSIALFLKALEGGQHLLAVRELSLSSAQGPVARHQPERLQLDVVVEGLFRARAPERRP